MFFIILVILLFAVDLLVKKVIEKKIKKGDTKELIKDKVDLTHLENDGLMMGKMKEKRTFIKYGSLIVLGAFITIFFQVIFSKSSKTKKFGVSLVMAGALSNVYERVFKGHVVDYINIKSVKKLKKIVFNLADAFLFIGGIITIVAEIFSKEK